jgi:hypothetical protein
VRRVKRGPCRPGDCWPGSVTDQQASGLAFIPGVGFGMTAGGLRRPRGSIPDKSRFILFCKCETIPLKRPSNEADSRSLISTVSVPRQLQDC